MVKKRNFVSLEFKHLENWFRENPMQRDTVPYIFGYDGVWNWYMEARSLK